MLAFWPDVLCPVLSELRPQAIVEIGAESGKVTTLLLDLVQTYGGVVTSIDPAPRFDVALWEREHASTFRFLRMPSLDAIGGLGRLDAVFIDGDHNWYTVYHELQAIERRASELRTPTPIVFLHDITWPYGRRDLYYDPATIPEPYRHAWERRGIHPASNALVERGGINAHLCNATREGGPRNGVLTAVEDYLAATTCTFDFIKIPAVFGLGILVPTHLRLQHASTCAFLRLWSDTRVERFISRLELARVATALPPLPPPDSNGGTEA